MSSPPPAPSSPYVADADRARLMLAARRGVQAHLPRDLLHDPALDMLLTIFIAQSDGVAIQPDAAALSTTVGATTARRWLRVIRQHDLVEITNDGVRLTENGLTAVSAAIRAGTAGAPTPGPR